MILLRCRSRAANNFATPPVPFRYIVYIALLGAGLSSAAAAPPSNEQAAHRMHLEKFVLPEFPTLLRANGVTQGSVVVAIGRDAFGHPNDLLVLESTNGQFSDAAVRAIHQWKFSPPATGGEVAPLVPVARVVFSVQGVIVTPVLTAADGHPVRGAGAAAPVSLPSFQDLDATPRILKQPMPTVAHDARERLAGGFVTVKFFVDVDGHARVPTILETSSVELAEATSRAVWQWRFETPRRNGRPVIAIATQTFHVES